MVSSSTISKRGAYRARSSSSEEKWSSDPSGVVLRLPDPPKAGLWSLKQSEK